MTQADKETIKSLCETLAWVMRHDKDEPMRELIENFAIAVNDESIEEALAAAGYMAGAANKILDELQQMWDNGKVVR